MPGPARAVRHVVQPGQFQGQKAARSAAQILIALVGKAAHIGFAPLLRAGAVGKALGQMVDALDELGGPVLPAQHLPRKADGLEEDFLIKTRLPLAYGHHRPP